MFHFNDAVNTFYLRLYGVRHMAKDHMAREETRCHHMGYSFRLAAKVLLYAPPHRQDNTYNGRGSLAGTRNSSVVTPQRIDPTTQRTMSERSYFGATSRSVSTRKLRNIIKFVCSYSKSVGEEASPQKSTYQTQLRNCFI